MPKNRLLNAHRQFERMFDPRYTTLGQNNSSNTEDKEPVLLGYVKDDWENRMEIFIPQTEEQKKE